MSESAVLEFVVEDVSEAVWEGITRDLMGVVVPDMLPPDSCQGNSCGVGAPCDLSNPEHPCP